jgi:hypothetical protein
VPIALPPANQVAEGIESQTEALGYSLHQRVKFNEDWYKQEAQPVNAIVDVIRRPDVDLDSGIGQITVNPGTDKQTLIFLSVIVDVR